MRTYLSWHKCFKTIQYTNDKGIYTGTSQADSLHFSAGMLAYQLLIHLQKDKKFGLGVHRTETKPIFCIYIAYFTLLCSSLNFFFLEQCMSLLNGPRKLS